LLRKSENADEAGSGDPFGDFITQIGDQGNDIENPGPGNTCVGDDCPEPCEGTDCPGNECIGDDCNDDPPAEKTIISGKLRKYEKLELNESKTLKDVRIDYKPYEGEADVSCEVSDSNAVILTINENKTGKNKINYDIYSEKAEEYDLSCSAVDVETGEILGEEVFVIKVKENLLYNGTLSHVPAVTYYNGVEETSEGDSDGEEGDQQDDQEEDPADSEDSPSEDNPEIVTRMIPIVAEDGSGSFSGSYITKRLRQTGELTADGEMTEVEEDAKEEDIKVELILDEDENPKELHLSPAKLGTYVIHLTLQDDILEQHNDRPELTVPIKLIVNETFTHTEYIVPGDSVEESLKDETVRKNFNTTLEHGEVIAVVITKGMDSQYTCEFKDLPENLVVEPIGKTVDLGFLVCIIRAEGTDKETKEFSVDSLKTIEVTGDNSFHNMSLNLPALTFTQNPCTEDLIITAHYSCSTEECDNTAKENVLNIKDFGTQIGDEVKLYFDATGGKVDSYEWSFNVHVSFTDFNIKNLVDSDDVMQDPEVADQDELESHWTHTDKCHDMSNGPRCLELIGLLQDDFTHPPVLDPVYNVTVTLHDNDACPDRPARKYHYGLYARYPSLATTLVSHARMKINLTEVNDADDADDQARMSLILFGDGQNIEKDKIKYWGGRVQGEAARQNIRLEHCNEGKRHACSEKRYCMNDTKNGGGITQDLDLIAVNGVRIYVHDDGTGDMFTTWGHDQLDWAINYIYFETPTHYAISHARIGCEMDDPGGNADALCSDGGETPSAGDILPFFFGFGDYQTVPLFFIDDGDSCDDKNHREDLTKYFMRDKITCTKSDYNVEHWNKNKLCLSYNNSTGECNKWTIWRKKAEPDWEHIESGYCD